MLVDGASQPDIYYRPEYAHAYEVIGEGKAVALVISADGVRALFPLLLRPLSRLPFARTIESHDAATPYGYGGFLLLDGAHSIDASVGKKLLSALRQWLREHHIVTAYLRLHPILKQENCFGEASQIGIRTCSHGVTTAIDTTCCDSDEAMLSMLSTNRRRNMKTARSKLSVTWSSETGRMQSSLTAFRRLYEHRMDALNAGGNYRFPSDYYRALSGGRDGSMEIGLAWDGDEVVGAMLFLIGETQWHYHLGGTDEVGRKYGASTLLMCEAARRAHAQGRQYLHMGGGLQGDDSLLAFKKSFGGPIFQYSTVSLICDPAAYAELKALRNAWSGESPRAGFFPEYRG